MGTLSINIMEYLFQSNTGGWTSQACEYPQYHMGTLSIMEHLNFSRAIQVGGLTRLTNCAVNDRPDLE